LQKIFKVSGKILSPFTAFPLEKKFSVKDYLVSGEKFDLYHDKEWDMLITHPQPANLSGYYQSKNYQPHKKDKNNWFDKLYNLIRNHSFRYKYRLIKKQHPHAKSLLDYGTATGDFLEFMTKETFSVSGVEPNKKARTIANERLDNKVAVSIDELDNRFDVITLWHVLEHVPEPEKLIEKLKERLQPNGIILVAVPNFKSYDAGFYGKYWAAYDVPRHLWHFSANAVQKLFNRHKMELIAQKPLYFDSFYVSLLSEQYKTGKKRLIPAVYRGCLSNIKAWKTGEYSSLIYVLRK